MESKFKPFTIQELPIANRRMWFRYTAVGVCTKDTDITEVDPSETRIPWKNLGYMYFGSGRVEKSGELVGQAEPFGTGDVIGCHIDLASGIMYFRKNDRKIGEFPSRSLLAQHDANFAFFQVCPHRQPR